MLIFSLKAEDNFHSNWEVHVFSHTITCMRIAVKDIVISTKHKAKFQKKKNTDTQAVLHREYVASKTIKEDELNSFSFGIPLLRISDSVAGSHMHIT